MLLTQREFAPTVAGPFQSMAPGVALQVAATLPELETLTAAPAPVRLISFSSDVIVPQRILDRMSGAYNFHPGPPAYPGIFPSVFALYDGAQTFGVTLHEMTAQVDAGPIVATESFAIPDDCDRLALDTTTFPALLDLLRRYTKPLADLSALLPRSAAAWGKRRYTRKDFDALCRLPEDVSTAEFARRYRAVGEGPEHALTFTRFGRTFRLESQARGPVFRGGQPMD